MSEQIAEQDAVKTLADIREAYEAVQKTKKDIKCTCSGFTLQYEGSCQCGSKDEYYRAERHFWSVIGKLERK